MIFYIGISGKMGSGKDTVAKIIEEILKTCNIRVEIIPFALELKRMVMELFKYTEEEVYRTKPPEVREILQRFGTDVIRKRQEDFWIRQLERNAQKVDSPFGYVFVVVPDVRFENEAEFVKGQGGLLFRVQRNEASEAARKEESGQHRSEIDLDSKPWLFHETIYNNSTFNELRDRVREALKPVMICESLDQLEIGMKERASGRSGE